MNQTIDPSPTAQCQTRVFPAEGTNLSKILSDAEYRRSFHGQLKQYNPMVVALYRAGILPLFGVGRSVMLLATKGKKSGKLRRTPIGYFRIGGLLYLFSAWGKNTSWYKNMLANPNDIWIQVGLRTWPVRAQTLEDPVEIHCLLEQFIDESPTQARYMFGWDPATDRMENADFSPVIERVLIVRFTEKR